MLLDIQFPNDDGSCPQYTDQHSCLKRIRYYLYHYLYHYYYYCNHYYYLILPLASMLSPTANGQLILILIMNRYVRITNLDLISPY